MKSLKLFSFALLAVVFVLGTSCGKYEEGPGFSLMTKKARVAGVWKLEKYVSANGTVTNADADDNTTFEFTKDGSVIITSTDGGTSFTINGTWEFTKDKEYIKTTLVFFGQTSTDEVKILRLTNKEFWTVDEDGDETHMIPA
jgi:uncharacterized protein (TIGR03066 family)